MCGKHGNGKEVFDWEWVGMGMIPQEWEGMKRIRVIPTHP